MARTRIRGRAQIASESADLTSGLKRGLSFVSDTDGRSEKEVSGVVQATLGTTIRSFHLFILP
jgi:hypothetical protein